MSDLRTPCPNCSAPIRATGEVRDPRDGFVMQWRFDFNAALEERLGALGAAQLYAFRCALYAVNQPGVPQVSLDAGTLTALRDLLRTTEGA